MLALQNDQAYITMMGFDCESFDKVFERFAPMFPGYTPFESSDQLIVWDLVLVRMQTRGSLNVFAACFWTVYLRFGNCLIVETLHDNPLA